ncbi:MAG: TIGR03435 family protein [Acidobacteriaceae bacterium]
MLNVRLSLKSVLLFTAILSVSAPSVPAQSAAAPNTPSVSQSVAPATRAYSFDIISIKRNKLGGPQQVGPTPDGYRMRNLFFIFPILTAYTPTNGAAMYSDDQLIGFPDWVMNDSYDIDAKVSAADEADWQNPALQSAMLRSMLQNLLADRLKLAVHRQQKERKILLLEVAKGGPKFKETDPAQAHAGFKLPGGAVWSTEVHDGQMISRYYGMSMPMLASLLSNKAGIPVQDKTGLTGRYDLTLTYPAPACAPHCRDQGPSASADEPSPSSEASDLGLRLESVKGQAEVLALDHVERPTEN